MLIVFNRLIPTEKPLWRDSAFSGENHVKKQQECAVYSLNHISGELLHGFLVDCDIEGVLDPFVRAAEPAVFHLEKRQIAEKYIMKIRDLRL